MGKKKRPRTTNARKPAEFRLKRRRDEIANRITKGLKELSRKLQRERLSELSPRQRARSGCKLYAIRPLIWERVGGCDPEQVAVAYTPAGAMFVSAGDKNRILIEARVAYPWSGRMQTVTRADMKAKGIDLERKGATPLEIVKQLCETEYLEFVEQYLLPVENMLAPATPRAR